jgi:ankyrin repeat protein
VSHADVVRALLEAGAAVDAVDATGRTPLFRAAAEGNEAALLVLLDAEADVNHLAPGAPAPTPLLEAIRSFGERRSGNQRALLRYLGQGDAAAARLVDRETRALGSRYMLAIELLLRRGADPDLGRVAGEAGQPGLSALALAGEYELGNVVGLLADYGAR